MIRSIVRAVSLGAAALGAMCVTQAASATQFIYDFTGMSSSASSGHWLDASSTSGSGPALDIFGGHVNSLGTSGQSSVSGATVTGYQGAGLGVLFGTDSTSNGTHQMDNVGGGADFVALVFDQNVTLASIARANYSNDYAHPTTGYDTDASYMAYSGSLSDLATSGVNLAGFSSLFNSDTATSGTGSSKIWLVSAYTGGQTDDAFKLRSIVVNTPNAPGPVPEPATWAMMLAGFGMVGFALRRRRPAFSTFA